MKKLHARVLIIVRVVFRKMTRDAVWKQSIVAPDMELGNKTIRNQSMVGSVKCYLASRKYFSV